jgi:hypothetical protein
MAPTVIDCKSCNTRVMPLSNGLCPACGKDPATPPAMFTEHAKDNATDVRRGRLVMLALLAMFVMLEAYVLAEQLMGQNVHHPPENR